MQRYTVTIVSPGTTGERPVLLVPFQPSALVTAFVDELYKRIARQGLAIAPNTHIATLHLDSETGGIIDYEDVLSDVVLDPRNDKVFAVFDKRITNAGQPPNGAQVADTPMQEDEGQSPSISLRIITPATAKDRTGPVVRLPVSTTIHQLHENVAKHLEIQVPKFDDDADMRECNCKLANSLADGPGQDSSFLVVHGKSVVDRLDLDDQSEASVKLTLSTKYGQDVENNKRVVFVGSEIHPGNMTRYKKNPVVAICSKNRHTPIHARVDIEDANQKRSSVLDLHTSELPIHPACMTTTLQEVGLEPLAIDGVVDLYAVLRRTTGNNAASIGKNNIFRSRPHWEPRVQQSDRGVAMFLSSLRVFTSLVQHMGDDERMQDAVLHAFDLLVAFPPALRTLYVLIQGKTPTAMESAAFGQAMFEVLDSFMADFTDIIGTDHTRVFEGARLFFGFIMEKARTLKLSGAGGTDLPYLSAMWTVEVRDHSTNEAVMHAVMTSGGLVEAEFFDAFQEGGLLASSHLQAYMVKTTLDTSMRRQALLGGGTASELLVFSRNALNENYRYPDGGDLSAAIDIGELGELNHLAELCGRNKLAVHKPSQLSSAVAPCLTFDRAAHLAVYTGEQPCGTPGQSSIIFRPKHGDETIDAAVIAQLIAPLLAKYQSDGTAVFDALGGAAVRRLENPEELLMFCVDCSASMRNRTDFAEVNEDDELDDPGVESNAQALVEGEYYNRATFDDMKERLAEYESFHDMLAIVSEATDFNRRDVAAKVLKILRLLLSSTIIKKHEILGNRRNHSRAWYHLQQEIATLESELKKLKTLWAGLKTHEESVTDFLIYRATSTASEISQTWSWSLGDEVPAGAASIQHIPSLDDDVVDLPHHLRCPVSHTLMLDAVAAKDGHTYSQAAISQWFSIRHSSPMTGLPLQDISLSSNPDLCDTAQRWMSGDGIPGLEVSGEPPLKRLRSKELEVTFDSRVGSFQRRVSNTLSLKDLYKLAFRGLKARFIVFQLSTDRYGPLFPSPEATVTSRDIRDGDHINIRIAEDDPTSTTSPSTTSGSNSVLIKVYQRMDSMLFGYWVKKDSPQTLATILWKYWRQRFSNKHMVFPSEKQIWMDLSNDGDGSLIGQPKQSTDTLSRYLNRSHCTGRLEDEKVYREDDMYTLRSNGPLVLKVKIEPPYRPKRAHTHLTRLDVLKQMFEALINRLLAYNYKTHVGLITFASKPTMSMGMTHVLENFRRSVSDMSPSGDTALFDALALAKDQLVEKGKDFPNAKKRIICISDGVDTKSTTNTASEISWRLREAGITLDSVSLGDEENLDLRTISYVLGAYRFHPTTLTNALAICELEPFLSITERPPLSPPTLPRNRLEFMAKFYQMKYQALFTVANEDVFPPRKSHPNIDDEFVELTAAAARPNAVNSTSGSRSNLRTSRLLNEMRAIANSSHPTYDVYVSETDMSFWKVVMSGPDESPYSEGTFLLYLHADEGYPTFAPKARFITRMKHPNINTHGRVCHSIFDRDWTSDTSMTTLLDSIYGLLLQPEYSDPVNTMSTLGFHHDQVEFADEVREHVENNASRSRESWKKLLLEGVDDDMPDSGEDFDSSSGVEDEEVDDEDVDETYW